MYVNIKILAAFPWFQALNVLVILTLPLSEERSSPTGEPRMLYREKASKVPVPSARASASLSPETAASTAIKGLHGLNVCSKNPAFQVAGHGREGHWRWT